MTSQHDKAKRWRPRISVRALVITAGILVAMLASGWASVRRAALSLRVSFANDQTAIFEQMTGDAAEALSHTPPDIGAAISCLRYTRRYYPSGTKQRAGSELDAMVERAREFAEGKIIDMLRDTTGRNLDYDAWVQE